MPADVLVKLECLSEGEVERVKRAIRQLRGVTSVESVPGPESEKPKRRCGYCSVTDGHEGHCVYKLGP
jgi:hypothetical protein